VHVAVRPLPRVFHVEVLSHAPLPSQFVTRPLPIRRSLVKIVEVSLNKQTNKCKTATLNALCQFS
jgi:hypothetical protein